MHARRALAALSSGALACTSDAAPALPEHHWAPVYADSLYRVALDTAHVRRDGGDAYLVWIETRHLERQVEDGRPFDREVIRSFLRCDPLAFKHVGLTLSLGSGPVVAWHGGDVRRAWAGPWRPTIPGSVDEGAFSRACALLGDIARR